MAFYAPAVGGGRPSRGPLLEKEGLSSKGPLFPTPEFSKVSHSSLKIHIFLHYCLLFNLTIDVILEVSFFAIFVESRFPP